MTKLNKLTEEIARLSAAEAALGKTHRGSDNYFSALDEWINVRDSLRAAIAEYTADDNKSAERSKKQAVKMVLRQYGIKYRDVFYYGQKKEVPAE